MRVLGNVSGDGVWCLTETQPSGLCRSTTPLHPVLHQDGIDQARTHVVSGDPVVPRHRELFYVLVLDHKAVQVNPKTSFEDYWGELSKVIPNLSGRPGMERLNRVRVNLKHHGSIPGIQQVADARTDVEVSLPRTPRRSSAWTMTLSRWRRGAAQTGRTKVRAAAAVEAAAAGDGPARRGVWRAVQPALPRLHRAIATIVRHNADVAHQAS